MIDIDGNIIINPIYDEISGYFQNRYMRVRNNGKTGVIDVKSKAIIPIQYDDISDLKEELCDVFFNCWKALKLVL